MRTVTKRDVDLGQTLNPKPEAAYFYHASYLDGLLKGQISEAEAKAAPKRAAPSGGQGLRG